MKEIINLKHWKAIFYSLIFINSLLISKKYTDPFFTPKNMFFFFSSGIFILLVLFSIKKKKVKNELNLSYLDITIAVFLIFSLIRLIFTEGVSVDNLKFYLISINVFLYYLSQSILFESSQNKYSQVKTIVNVLLIIALIHSVWGMLQYFEITENMQREFKIGSSFGNPGQFTNFITPILAFALAIALFSKTNRVFGIVAFAAILIVLPLTQARTAWIAALVIIIYLADKKFLFSKKVLGLIKAPLLRLTILAVVVAGIFFSAAFLYNMKKSSSSGRLFIWEVSLDMIKDKPLWGFGFDRYAAAHNYYQADYFKNNPDDKERSEIADSVNYAFNEFIQVAVECGLAAFILLALIFVFALLPLKTVEEKDNENVLYYYAAKACVIAILISMLFSYPLHTVSSLGILFFSLAIINSYNFRKGLKLSLSATALKNLCTAGIIVISVFLIMQYNRNKAERKWVEAYTLMRQNDQEGAYKIYLELYPRLKYSQFFRFNFGAELSLMQKYRESIEVLNDNEVRLNDSDHFIYLGNSYENSGYLKEAEKCYLQASNIMPLKFFPKYRLVRIYSNTGRKDEALKLAKTLIEMKVKIPSQAINVIKQEMKQFVDQNEKH